jgi:hypothetical protein
MNGPLQPPARTSRRVKGGEKAADVVLARDRVAKAGPFVPHHLETRSRKPFCQADKVGTVRVGGPHKAQGQERACVTVAVTCRERVRTRHQEHALPPGTSTLHTSASTVSAGRTSIRAIEQARASNISSGKGRAFASARATAERPRPAAKASSEADESTPTQHRQLPTPMSGPLPQARSSTRPWLGRTSSSQPYGLHSTLSANDLESTSSVMPARRSWNQPRYSSQGL